MLGHIRKNLLRMCGWLLLVLTVMAGPATLAAEDTSLITWDALAPSGAPSVVPAGPAGGHADQPRGLDAVAPQVDWAGPGFAVASNLTGRDVTIDGYVLPLVWDGRRVIEFLLVPWIGACIHTPSPAANQIIHVSYPDGLRLNKPYDPVRLTGTLQHAPAYHMLFLVDGSRPIPTSYALEGAATAGTPGQVTAASAASVPALLRAQIWVNTLFTNSMSAIDTNDSPTALLFALLLAFGYGALHTFGPGHGKAVVVSYFVGTGGSLNRGLRMGLQIAVFHVLSAVILVFLLDFTVRQVTGAAPSDYRAIRLASYALIVAIGAVMVWHAVQAAVASRTVARAALHHHGAHHHHGHEHDGHQHHGCAACAAAANPKGAGWVAAAVGVVPCTGALIVMLFGLANGLVWPAVLMVVAISAGMALAMSAIGVAALMGRNWAERRFAAGNAPGQSRFATGARLVGSVCVLAIGSTFFVLTALHPPVPIIQVDAITAEANPNAKPSG